MSVVQILMWIFTAICWWKIFEKAGIKGWKAFIPFYEDYIKFGMADKKLLYIPFLILTLAETVVNFIYTALNLIELADSYSEQLDLSTDLNVLFWVRLVLSVLIFLISIHVGIVISAKFKKKPIFGVGLGVLEIVFAPILAFDRSTYIDNKEI